LKEKITFEELNIQDHLISAEKYGAMGILTFKLFCQGRPIQNYIGEMYPSLIKKMIEDGLSERAQWSIKQVGVILGLLDTPSCQNNRRLSQNFISTRIFVIPTNLLM
jgi:hypothetical protein